MDNIYKSDATLLCYKDSTDPNAEEIVLGSILANHSMSVDDALDSLGIDMDEWVAARDWDGWDWDDLYTRPDYIDGYDWEL